MITLKASAPHIYSISCPSHLVNICVKTAAKELSVTPEELIDIDIYYYFEKSSKWTEALKEFQEFCNVAYQRVHKHWLSLRKGLEHLFLQWPVFIIQKRLKDSQMKIYTCFLHNVLTNLIWFFKRRHLSSSFGSEHRRASAWRKLYYDYYWAKGIERKEHSGDRYEQHWNSSPSPIQHHQPIQSAFSINCSSYKKNDKCCFYFNICPPTTHSTHNPVSPVPKIWHIRN